jgi:hypothetical protein
LLKITQQFLGNYFMRIMDVLNWAWASVTVFGECAMRCIALYGFDYIIPINVKVNLLTFWLISFRMWNCPRCMRIHAADSWADPSVTMHRVVHILFVFKLCLVPVSEQLASIGPPAENCSKLNAIHSMRRDAGRGKPDAPKQLPLSFGFKCAHCGSEFESWAGMAQHRRNGSFVGTLCADPRNSKSMSLTARGDRSAGILRQHDYHDTVGV